VSLELERYRAETLKKLHRRRKGAEKGIEKWKSQLETAKNWRLFEREALIIQANLYQIPAGQSQVQLLDWETGNELTIALDPLLPAAEQIKSRIKKSKKAKAGIPHLEQQIVQLQTWAASLSFAIKQVESATNAEEIKSIEEEFALSRAVKKAEAAIPVKKLPYKEYHSTSGRKIWVGKGAKDNDQLTFTHANGSDWWLHVNEYSGSHVVIKSKDGQEPDAQTIFEASQLAIGQSKAPKRGKVEICITQVKHVKKFKGAKPGSVHLSKHKKILGEFDKAKYDSILRLLP
jgi:predicted ribosome quality control (RQC) complex YloA/Tae2 family protein